MAATTPEEVLEFWYSPEVRGKKMWYKKDPEFDDTLRKKFGDLHKKAAKEELADWMKEPKSCLALIIILDQFSRNMFRDTPEAFASDELCLKYAQEAVAKGFDKDLSEDGERGFIFSPYMHSEDIGNHP